MRNKSYLEIYDELNQHLAQAKSLVTYLMFDYIENENFSANSDVVSDLFWTVETLLGNAIKSADDLYRAGKESQNLLKLAEIENRQAIEPMNRDEEEA